MELQLAVISGRECLFMSFPDDPEPEYIFRVSEGQTLTIGRGNSCDIRLSGCGTNQADGCIVARHHVDLKYCDGLVKILDYGVERGQRFDRRVFLNSRCLAGNGTEWHVLRPGDQLRVGDVLFRLNPKGLKGSTEQEDL